MSPDDVLALDSTGIAINYYSGIPVCKVRYNERNASVRKPFSAYALGRASIDCTIIDLGVLPKQW